MSDAGEPRRIGAGPFTHVAQALSPEWFPQLVTPRNYLDYWNEVDGVNRPILARHWLARGFDSEQLRWLANLDD